MNRAQWQVQNRLRRSPEAEEQRFSWLIVTARRPLLIASVYVALTTHNGGAVTHDDYIELLLRPRLSLVHVGACVQIHKSLLWRHLCLFLRHQRLTPQLNQRTKIFSHYHEKRVKMPWNRIYYHPNSLAQEEKDVIAKGITDIYAEKYPSCGTVCFSFWNRNWLLANRF